MSALDASQDREGHEIDSGGRSESDDEFDQDSVAIGNLAAAARAKLADQLLASGRADAAVEAAFRGVPRHTFLPEMDPVEAYQDRAVVIKSDSEGLPVSASTQPTMMAVMLSQLGLAAGHRVLEIGTGTGYNAALIARIVGDQKSVVTIDVVPDLIGQARVNLTAAGMAASQWSAGTATSPPSSAAAGIAPQPTNEATPPAETTMRAAFADHPVHTQAADAQSQPDRDAPRQAFAPAATHEAMAPLTRRLQRIAGLLMRLSGTRASYYDPYAEVIEDDYYRFRNQPRD